MRIGQDIQYRNCDLVRGKTALITGSIGGAGEHPPSTQFSQSRFKEGELLGFQTVGVVQ